MKQTNKTTQSKKVMFALPMIYLVLFLMLMNNSSAGAAVSLASGDLAVDVPLMNVPGTGGLSFPISLAYVGGGGVSLNNPASWVGLGWSLSAGSVNRGVVGLPDDMLVDDVDNIYIELEDNSYHDSLAWWEVLIIGFTWVFVIGFIVSITGGWAANFIEAGGSWLIVMGVTMAVNIILVPAVYSMLNAALGNGNFFELYGASFSSLGSMKLGDVIPVYSQIKSIKSSLSNPGTVQGLLTGTSLPARAFQGGTIQSQVSILEIPKRQAGFLFAPHFQEDYSDDNALIHDGGQPDLFSVSSPVSGRMIYANKNNQLEPIDSPADVKFYLAETRGIDNVDIQFSLMLDNCDYLGDLSSTCSRYSEDIDQFVIIAEDGTKYVFGDPEIEGSLERVHASGSYGDVSYHHDEGDSNIRVHNLQVTAQHHIVSWKIVSILSPDYVDGSTIRDYNPADSDEALNKGSWIAFRYDLTNSFDGGNNANCGYNFGNTFDGSGTSTNGGTTFFSGGYKDVSYLSEIITPTHIAQFDISIRKDGKEVAPWFATITKKSYNILGGLVEDITEKIGPWSYDFSDGDWATDGTTCTSAQSDFLYKLDQISLKSRADNTILRVVKFNDGLTSDADLYKLRQQTPSSTASTEGVYTLNKITVYDKDGVSLRPTTFNYNLNPDYGKNKFDSFGLYYSIGTEDAHNAPTSFQNKFSATGTTDSEAWALTNIDWSSGATTSVNYESDTWFTSRGDEATPTEGVNARKNYYAYKRGDSSCSANFGGGIRVSSLVSCDGLNNCLTNYYNYDMYDSELSCTRTSGTIDSVPLTFGVTDPNAATQEEDLRRPSHRGGQYTSGSVLYNKITVTRNSGNGYAEHYFLTTDSTPSNTGGSIDLPAHDGFSGAYSGNYDAFGSEGEVNRDWSRGQEYKQLIYNEANQLVKSIERFFSTKEHFTNYMGDVYIQNLNPISGDLVENNPNYNRNAWGFSSGSLLLDETKMTVYDPVSGNNYLVSQEILYDDTTGSIEKITQKNKDFSGNRNQINTLTYCDEWYPNMNNSNMKQQICQSTTSENTIDNLKASNKVMYANVE